MPERGGLLQAHQCAPQSEAVASELLIHCVLCSAGCVVYDLSEEGRANKKSGFALVIGVLMLRFISLSSLIGLCLLFAVAQSAPPKAGQSAPPKADQSAPPKTGVDALPNGPGKQAVQKDCLSCHSVQITTSKRGTEDAWAVIVSQMIGRGAIVSNQDADTIVEYMAQHFGPSAPMPEKAAPTQNTQPTSSTAPASAPAGAGQGSEAKLPPVNVNWAAASELEWGLGLTPSEADAIVHYREQQGTFKDLQQLLSVPGIDAEKIGNEQKKIAFSTPTGRAN